MSDITTAQPAGILPGMRNAGYTVRAVIPSGSGWSYTECMAVCEDFSTGDWVTWRAGINERGKAVYWSGNYFHAGVNAVKAQNAAMADAVKRAGIGTVLSDEIGAIGIVRALKDTYDISKMKDIRRLLNATIREMEGR